MKIQHAYSAKCIQVFALIPLLQHPAKVDFTWRHPRVLSVCHVPIQCAQSAQCLQVFVQPAYLVGGCLMPTAFVWDVRRVATSAQCLQVYALILYLQHRALMDITCQQHQVFSVLIVPLNQIFAIFAKCLQVSARVLQHPALMVSTCRIRRILSVCHVPIHCAQRAQCLQGFAQILYLQHHALMESTCQQQLVLRVFHVLAILYAHNAKCLQVFALNALASIKLILTIAITVLHVLYH